MHLDTDSSSVLTILAAVTPPRNETPLLLLLTAAERTLAAALQEHLLAAGFHDHRLAHHNVMAHVTTDGIRLTDLAELAGLTKQAVSELVIDLERLGYLRRTADPIDRRAKLITFSDKGRAAVAAAMRAFDDMDAQLAERLGPRALATMRAGLVATIGAPLLPTSSPSASSGS